MFRLGLLALSSLIAGGAAMAETIPMDQISHIHDLAVDPDRPSQLFLATHNGLFLTAPDGTAKTPPACCFTVSR